MGNNLIEMRRRIMEGSPNLITKSGELLTLKAIAKPLDSCVISLTPHQSGSGDPYPPGGGKNKFDLSNLTVPQSTKMTVTTNGSTITLTVTQSANNLAAYFDIPATPYIGQSITISGTQTRTGSNKGRLILRTVTNDVQANLGRFDNDGYSSLTAVVPQCDYIRVYLGLTGNDGGSQVGDNCVYSEVQLEIGDTATTYAPYSNIRPISGVSSDAVVVTGVNVWDEETEGGLLNSDGTVTANQTRLVTKNYIPIVSGETYCVSIPYSGRGRGAFYDENHGLISYFGDFPKSGEPAVFPNDGTIYPSGSSYYFTFIAPSGACYLKYNIISAYGSTYNNDISFNYPSTDHSYHSGTANAVYHLTIPTPPGTVYGGEIKYQPEKKLIDKMGIADIGDLSWSYSSTYGIMSVSLAQGKSISAESLLCSVYKYGGYNVNNSEMLTAPDKTIWKRFGNGLNQNATAIYIKDSDYTDKDVFKTAMAGQKICYELAEPIEYNLSDLTDIETLNGVNNVWADDGELTVKYWGY